MKIKLLLAAFIAVFASTLFAQIRGQWRKTQNRTACVECKGEGKLHANGKKLKCFTCSGNGYTSTYGKVYCLVKDDGSEFIVPSDYRVSVSEKQVVISPDNDRAEIRQTLLVTQPKIFFAMPVVYVVFKKGTALMTYKMEYVNHRDNKFNEWGVQLRFEDKVKPVKKRALLKNSVPLPQDITIHRERFIIKVEGLSAISVVDSVQVISECGNQPFTVKMTDSFKKYSKGIIDLYLFVVEE